MKLSNKLISKFEYYGTRPSGKENFSLKGYECVVYWQTSSDDDTYFWCEGSPSYDAFGDDADRLDELKTGKYFDTKDKAKKELSDMIDKELKKKRIK